MHTPRTALALATVAVLASGCFVQIEDKSGGSNPCDPNPCVGAGVCNGWSATCSVTDGEAVCSGWKAEQGQTGESPASYEANESLCDGLDNDCDGLTDEGVVADPAKDCPTTGVCEGQAAKASCVNGAWICDFSVAPAWEVSETTCDGLDNDCDGTTDEDARPGLKTCSRVGVCAGLPEPTCAEGKWDCKYAEAPDYEATELSCDGKDNDCDGLADVNLSLNALPGGKSCQDKGLCAGGVGIICKGARRVCDYLGVPGYESVETVCDGKDNDCDGNVDNPAGPSYRSSTAKFKSASRWASARTPATR